MPEYRAEARTQIASSQRFAKGNAFALTDKRISSRKWQRPFPTANHCKQCFLLFSLFVSCHPIPQVTLQARRVAFKQAADHESRTQSDIATLPGHQPRSCREGTQTPRAVVHERGDQEEQEGSICTATRITEPRSVACRERRERDKRTTTRLAFSEHIKDKSVKQCSKTFGS